ncbi:hypothetical protein OIV83_004372 [Microbotryomycetes sp. JL201]|nr:hypothetical protein OIV83_004372 [Microbotryomycetes sp. JL201]
MATPIVKHSSNDADREEKGDLTSSSRSSSTQLDAMAARDAKAAPGGAVVSEKSRGVLQMEQLNARMSLKYRVLLYGGFALLAYVMSLDQYTNRSYLTTATSVSFAAHSTLATISTLKSVMQAVSQPPIAGMADVWGRLEAYSVCLFLYALGYVVVASAQSVYAYAAGASINVVGITGLFLLQNIIIGDISSLRNRLFWSIFPSIPGTINVWVSGNITQSLLGARQENGSMWRWGIGMFCILTPALATPIMLTLGIGMRKSSSTKLAVVAPTASTERSRLTLKQKVVSVFWQLDLVGLLLFVAGAGMVLVTITIANGKGSKWSDAHCIALLVVGGLCCIGFVLWERFGARHPLIPFALMKNRTVIICMLIAVIHPAAGGVVGGYLLTFLQVAANQTTLSAQRITSIASFSGTLVAAANGILVRYIRYLKPIIIVGFVLEVLAFGLMIRYRESTNSQGELAMVQVVRGVAVGCIGFPLQASIQSVVKHEHLGAITAGYLTVYYLAGGVGSAIAGGIWTNTVPEKIQQYMNNDTLAAQAFANPIGFISKFPYGTPERMAVARAQDEAQRIMCITGTAIAAVGLFLAFGLQSVKLTDDQSLNDEELNKLTKGQAQREEQVGKTTQ